MTLEHTSLTAADVRPLLDAGLTKEKIGDALEVAFLFNIYDRLADSMGWHVPEIPTGYYGIAAKRLLSRGYSV